MKRSRECVNEVEALVGGKKWSLGGNKKERCQRPSLGGERRHRKSATQLKGYPATR